ncbi:unnamed protein product [Mycena citricolor]|uniref:Uncharacterized protein n=1 Tax=Mycena citricolor TaxID=2018698 RepID=A0AAD2JW40_9AGAR|nr:unnamed protein product [Mycena citricolor]
MIPCALAQGSEIGFGTVKECGLSSSRRAAPFTQAGIVVVVPAVCAAGALTTFTVDKTIKPSQSSLARRFPGSALGPTNAHNHKHISNHTRTTTEHRGRRLRTHPRMQRFSFQCGGGHWGVNATSLSAGFQWPDPRLGL